jgi:hypothetical protein
MICSMLSDFNLSTPKCESATATIATTTASAALATADSLSAVYILPRPAPGLTAEASTAPVDSNTRAAPQQLLTKSSDTSIPKINPNYSTHSMMNCQAEIQQFHVPLFRNVYSSKSSWSIARLSMSDNPKRVRPRNT